MMIYGNFPWMEQTRPIVPTDSPIARLVDKVWEGYFADVIRCNTIMAGYDYPWKNRLGRIRMTLDGRRTEITINGFFAHVPVPEEVLIAIIGHEIVHYAQGFGSPYPRQHRHAHAHGVVSHELAHRGLEHHETFLDEWAIVSWPALRDEAQLLHNLTRKGHYEKITCVPTTQMVYYM
jgi:hypothetical protein